MFGVGSLFEHSIAYDGNEKSSITRSTLSQTSKEMHSRKAFQSNVDFLTKKRKINIERYTTLENLLCISAWNLKQNRGVHATLWHFFSFDFGFVYFKIEFAILWKPYFLCEKSNETKNLWKIEIWHCAPMIKFSNGTKL